MTDHMIMLHTTKSTADGNQIFGSMASELAKVGEELEKKMRIGHGITLIDKISKITAERLRKTFPEGPIIACDFHVEKIHLGEAFEWGYLRDGITNIDHHAPTPEMSKFISSGVQASIWTDCFGSAAKEVPVVINHTDCDSIISASIVRGLIPALPVFSAAVLNADHILKPDPIADLLQALEPAHDLELSLMTLACLLQGKELPKKTSEYIELDSNQRALARKSFDDGRFRFEKEVALLCTDSAVESQFAMAFFPEAKIVIIAYPRGDNWDIKIRLGAKAQEGLTLSELKIFDFDSQFGGRWNAGSTSRSADGTTITPNQYFEYLTKALQDLYAA